MKNYIQSLPRAIARAEDPEGIQRIINSALEAVNPQTAVERALTWDGQRLRIGRTAFAIGEGARVVVVAVGKAGIAMARGIAAVIGRRITRGVVLTKFIPDTTGLDDLPLRVLRGAHPVPDRSSVSGTDAVLEALQGLTEGDLVVCLISGGGSALLTKPISGVSLEDIQTLTTLLLGSGANIDEINTLRKHLDQVKGGRLAQLAAPAQVLTLVLSDVVGNPLATIASGPTVPDPSTYADAVEILERYSLINRIPPHILQVLEDGRSGKLPETMKAGDPTSIRSSVFLVGSNQVAARAALEQAEIEGYRPFLLTTYLQGEASQAGSFLAAVAREIVVSGHPLEPPVCLVAGGETTVTLKGDGRGGRNLELALGSVVGMAGLNRAIMATLATDGEDGSAPAAGAAVDGETLARSRTSGLALSDYLGRNDSYTFFKKLGDVLVTGPTGTNVNDLAFVFVR